MLSIHALCEELCRTYEIPSLDDPVLRIQNHVRASLTELKVWPKRVGCRSDVAGVDEHIYHSYLRGVMQFEAWVDRQISQSEYEYLLDKVSSPVQSWLQQDFNDNDIAPIDLECAHYNSELDVADLEDVCGILYIREFLIREATHEFASHLMEFKRSGLSSRYLKGWHDRADSQWQSFESWVRDIGRLPGFNIERAGHAANRTLAFYITVMSKASRDRPFEANSLTYSPRQITTCDHSRAACCR